MAIWQRRSADSLLGSLLAGSQRNLIFFLQEISEKDTKKKNAPCGFSCSQMNYLVVFAFVTIIVVPYVRATISDYRLCADPECKGKRRLA